VTAKVVPDQRWSCYEEGREGLANELAASEEVTGAVANEGNTWRRDTRSGGRKRVRDVAKMEG
jgi:hypothetical protein